MGNTMIDHNNNTSTTEPTRPTTRHNLPQPAASQLPHGDDNGGGGDNTDGVDGEDNADGGDDKQRHPQL